MRWASVAVLAACLLHGQTAKPGDGVPWTWQKELALGHAMEARAAAQAPPLQDARATAYIGAIFVRLRAQSPVAHPMTLHVRRSEKAFAEALPGGAIYISTGFIGRLRDESELAGILAHELAHYEVGFAHANSGPMPMVIVGCLFGKSAIAAFSSLSDALRDTELRANVAALKYVRAAGYDPAGLLAFEFRRLYARPGLQRVLPGEDLIPMQQEIDRETLTRELVTNTSEFQQIREALVPPAERRPVDNELRRPFLTSKP